MKLVNIREAKLDEVEILTNLAARSEAYWGFDNEYMDKFKVMYRVTKEFININSTFVIEEDNRVIGFYSILFEDNKNSLEYFLLNQNS